jgi:hypothetical protein
MPNNYVLLERIELNASAASVTFANIPQTGYTDLKVVVSGRCDAAQGVSNVRFNGLTTNLSSRILYAIGSGTPGSASYASNIRAGYIDGTDYTATTFASNEIYIPNYTSSNNKSVSVDSVTETNATEAYSQLVAGLWSSTAAITSVTLEVISNINGSAANFVANSTFSLYALAATGTTPTIAPKASGGNVIDYDGTYWIHTFNTNGTFTPQIGLTCDYLVVAGGGGGGGFFGGGGGAGGLRSTVTATGGGGSLESALSLSAQAYSVTVGAGGAAGAGTTSSTSIGTNGSDSIFSTITSVGGGGGAGFNGSSSGSNGKDGGSGGGASVYSGPSGTAGARTTNQGYAGGTALQTGGATSSGGGGGAGAVGANGTSGNGGAGGNGVASSITGTSTTRAGGGGGGVYASGTSGAGGSGGGGAGGATSASSTNGSAGTVNTGSGGGGARHIEGSAVTPGGEGGSGIVIIRYLAA